MKYNYLSFLALIFIVATGCSTSFDYYISDSVFIEDVDNPGLTIYSEKGYNSFGVYWGLSPLTPGPAHDPSKIVVKGDSCHIHLSGSIGGVTPYTLVLSLPDYLPENYTELLSLNNKSFGLTGTEDILSLLLGSEPLDLKILEGSFTIKRAQNIYVDKELEGVVLSGIFSFKGTVDDQPATFSNGRFDMRFGNENFFYLQEEE